jgi:hypothetical protein
MSWFLLKLQLTAFSQNTLSDLLTRMEALPHGTFLFSQPLIASWMRELISTLKGKGPHRACGQIYCLSVQIGQLIEPVFGEPGVQDGDKDEDKGDEDKGEEGQGKGDEEVEIDDEEKMLKRISSKQILPT